MAVPFPSYVDALVEGFPLAFKATSVPHHKYIEDSQNVGEFIEKLFSRLSVLLFHIDKQINKVLIQGRFLPKKLNQWATEARALKCQVSDLLERQQNRKGDSLKCEELVEIGIKMINHLKKCPCKDEMMYDKPVPVIIRTRESGLDKPSRRFEKKYSTGEKSYSEGKKMEHTQWNIEQTLNPSEGHDVRQDQYAGTMLTSAGTSLSAVDPQKKNDAVTLVGKLGSESMSTSESTQGAEIIRDPSSDVHDAVISVISPADSNSTSISEDLSEQQSADEITEEGMTLEDSEIKMSRSSIEQKTGQGTLNENMPISESDFDSQQGEIQIVHEIKTLTSAKNFSGEKREIESTSSKTEGSKHHEESIPSPITIDSVPEKEHYLVIVEEKEHYLVIVEDSHIKLKLDHQTILVGDSPSSAPPESSLVKAVLNLAERDLRELSEKPDYPNLLLLFLQRNERLTLIQSFFDSMPELRFLDLSDTRIRILPSSLFRLSKLKVLMLRNCVCLEKLPSEIGNLHPMEVLDLSGTELYNLPDEIGQLKLLRHMKLSFYGPDDESEYDHLPSQLVSPSFLSELKELQALSITVHPDDHRWTKIAASIIEDVGKLEMLSYLQFYFPEVEIFEHFIQTIPSWNNHKLTKFNFIIGHNVKRIVSRVPDEVESLFDQQDNCLRFVNGDKVTQVIKTVLFQVTAFYLDHHIEIQSLSEFGISNFQALKFCVARECPKIQAILDEKTAEGAFPCLEHLGVYYLWELKHIWKPPSPGRLKRIWKTPVSSGNFKALKCLIVNTCPKLQFILWESMLQCLSNLEELIVEDCERVEKIIKEENKKVNNNDSILPGLRKLVLNYLPELVSLGNGLCLSEDKISVYGCPKLIMKSQPQKQKKFLVS